MARAQTRPEKGVWIEQTCATGGSVSIRPLTSNPGRPSDHSHNDRFEHVFDYETPLVRKQ